MQCNFSIDQMKFLKVQSTDPEIKKGVCTGMVMEWLRREMTGEPQEFLFYKNTHNFASRHRALNDYQKIKNTLSLSFKSDFHKSTIQDPFNSTEFRYRMGKVVFGYFHIMIYSPWGRGHSIGMSIKNGVYRILDPNYGEFETIGKQSSNEALLKCQNLIFNYYPLANIPYMQITELNIK